MNEQERESFMAQRRDYFVGQGLSESEASVLVGLCLGVSERVGREFWTGITAQDGERLLCFYRPGVREGVGVSVKAVLANPNPALVAPRVARMLDGVDLVD